MSKTASGYLVEALEKTGVKRVYGVVGDSLNVAPFVRYLFLALAILLAVRFVVGRLGLRLIFAILLWQRRPCTSASSRLSSHFGSERPPEPSEPLHFGTNR
jgi:hypothetical protein